MMEERDSDDFGYYYYIRLLITHPTIPIAEISAALGMDPTSSWNAGDRTFTQDAMWNHTSSTEGKRRFGEEVHDVLVWMEQEHRFVARLLSTGGAFQVVVQLPGTINIGDSFELETMSLASKLGIRIGVEVFPDLQKPIG